MKNKKKNAVNISLGQIFDFFRNMADNVKNFGPFPTFYKKQLYKDKSTSI